MTSTQEGTGALTAGTVAATRRYGPISRTDIVRYAGAGGDFNPIHHDEPFAVAAGYRSVFGHGLLTAGILGTYVSGWLGQQNLTRFSVRYVDQVWPGDILVVDGRITSSTAVDDGLEVACELTVSAEASGADGDRRTGEARLVLTGAATACFRDEGGSDDDGER